MICPSLSIIINQLRMFIDIFSHTHTHIHTHTHTHTQRNRPGAVLEDFISKARKERHFDKYTRYDTQTPEHHPRIQILFLRLFVCILRRQNHVTHTYAHIPVTTHKHSSITPTFILYFEAPKSRLSLSHTHTHTRTLSLSLSLSLSPIHPPP